MDRKYTEIDAGHTLINMAVEQGRHGIIITAFINGLSVRGNLLNLPRVVALFIECVLAACDFPDGADEQEANTYTALQQFVASKL